MSAGKNKRNLTLIRAYHFKWWTPDVADVVEREGSSIAWYFETPVSGPFLTLHARFGDCRVSMQVVLKMVELCRVDMIAETMRKMVRLIDRTGKRRATTATAQGDAVKGNL